jgi:hypothetical protein
MAGMSFLGKGEFLGKIMDHFISAFNYMILFVYAF